MVLLIALLLPTKFVMAQSIFKCTDPSGAVIFSDVARKGCVKLDLPKPKLDPQQVSIMGFSKMSCGDWVASQHSDVARAQYLAWLRGFASGYNSSTVTGQVRYEDFPDTASLELYIDKYCRENPLAIFPGAAFALMRELPHAEPKPTTTAGKK